MRFATMHQVQILLKRPDFSKMLLTQAVAQSNHLVFRHRRSG